MVTVPLFGSPCGTPEGAPWVPFVPDPLGGAVMEPPDGLPEVVPPVDEPVAGVDDVVAAPDVKVPPR